jgi:RNA polymerase sigma-70 factor (ECF subfamily)
MTSKGSYTTDEQLFAMMADGKAAAYSEIYERYWPVLFIHATKILQNENDAMDIVQDVFTTLWLKRHDIEIKVSLKAYLYTSVRNQTLNHIQKSKSRDRYLSSLLSFVSESKSEVEERLIFKEFNQLIDEEINQLPAKTKAIFELSRKHGYSNGKIADELKITPNTVKKTINRAIKKIKLKLDKVTTLLF